MSVHVCDLCGGSGTPLSVFEEAHVCNDCGFIFVPVRRTPEAIADDWETVYLSGGYDPQWPGVQARLFYVAEWLDNRFGLESKTVLDIGAGDGTFMGFLDPLGATCAGIEPSAKNTVKWDEDWIALTGPWEQFTDFGKVDVCTINWTLENCGDPVGMLKFAAEHADLVSVATGSRILVPFKKPYSHYISDKEIPDLHAFRWSRNSLAFAMFRAGLQVVEVNDFPDRDEMIVVGRKMSGPRPETDDPTEIQEYFRLWKNLFP